METDTPERGGAHFGGRVVKFGSGEVSPVGLVHLLAIVLQHGHDEAVAGADIVEKEITVGVKLLAAERIGDGKSATIDGCAGGGGSQSLNMARVAANGVEQFGAMAGLRGLR